MPENAKVRKLAYSINEVCRLTELDVSTLESWEKELSFLNAGKTRTGKKFFRERDLAIIIRLKQLVEDQSMTLAGAKRRVESEFGIRGAATPPEKLKKTLNRVRNQLKDLCEDLEKPLLP